MKTKEVKKTKPVVIEQSILQPKNKTSIKNNECGCGCFTTQKK